MYPSKQSKTALTFTPEPTDLCIRSEPARTLAPGAFGENLTISTLESTLFRIGDRLHMGEVILEVTATRIPCDTFATRMGAPMLIKRFRKAGRPGLYCRGGLI